MPEQKPTGPFGPSWTTQTAWALGDAELAARPKTAVSCSAAHVSCIELKAKSVPFGVLKVATCASLERRQSCVSVVGLDANGIIVLNKYSLP
jgi:hypothetical protein